MFNTANSFFHLIWLQANWKIIVCLALQPATTTSDSLESGNTGIWKSRNLEIWIISMEIRSTPNVGKVLISRKRNSRPHLVQFLICFP